MWGGIGGGGGGGVGRHVQQVAAVTAAVTVAVRIVAPGMKMPTNKAYYDPNVLFSSAKHFN